METLTRVVPKEFPPSGPLRIILCVEGYLLHHFDPDLPKTLTRDDFMNSADRPVTRQLARLALNTCSRSEDPLPNVSIKKAFMGHSANDSWGLLVKVDCPVSSTDNGAVVNGPVANDTGVVYFQSNKELDDEGNVEFVTVVPETAEAKAKHGYYDTIFPTED